MCITVVDCCWGVECGENVSSGAEAEEASALVVCAESASYSVEISASEESD